VTASRLRLVVAAVLTVAVVLVVGVAIGRLTSPTPVVPGTDSVEAGFSRDMQVHHEQAVEMSMTVRDLTDDPAVRTMAYDIATAQAQQAGQMYAWLQVWGVPQAPSEPSMTWMTRPTLDAAFAGHDHEATGEPAGGASTAPTHRPGDPMPGLASADDLRRLAALDGVEAERLWLELMIAHHQGGVEMAEAVLARSRDREVLAFATGVVTTQESEITAMEQMLADRR